MPILFWIGSAIAQRLQVSAFVATPLRVSSGLLVALYAVLFLAFGAAAREVLFQGYTADAELSPIVGPMATLQMALLFQYVAAAAAGLSSARWIALLLAATSVSLLGMGGRLYVVSALVALYFHWWKWRATSKASRRRSLIWIAVVPLGLALIGMWRLGDEDFTTLGFYLFAEPMFTSISAFTLMQGGAWTIFDVPKDFFSAFLNVVPASLWHGKASALESLATAGLHIESPFGALSIVASTIGNFGFMGGLLFVLGVGFAMGRVSQHVKRPAGRALYCYLVGMLPFLFFRDPFSVQIKLVVTGFLLVWLNRLLSLAAPTSEPHTHVIDSTSASKR